MEKGEGPELAMEWGIQAYPTLIIFDPSGKAISGTVGYMSGADLVRFGKQALAQSANWNPLRPLKGELDLLFCMDGADWCNSPQFDKISVLSQF